MDPYEMGGIKLDFENFPDILKETKDEKGKIKIAIVFGSGRFTGANHIGYITDALFVPEIVIGLNYWAIKNRCDLIIKSHLDIDCDNQEYLTEYNFISIGSGRVNKVSKMVQDYFGKGLKVRFVPPNAPTIVSDLSGFVYTIGIAPGERVGILTLLCNPWAKDESKKRLIVLAAGNFPLGTIAALQMLAHFVKEGRGRNNMYNPQIPAIVC